MKNKLKMIYVKFSKEGIHRFENSGFDPAFSDVKFLSYPHRHIFHVKIKIEVFHNDRDIEFIQFKRFCESLWADIYDFENFSCEMISDMFYDLISKKYPNRDMIIDVSEDNENGSLIIYEKG